jgi:hypothetical protein
MSHGPGKAKSELCAVSPEEVALVVVVVAVVVVVVVEFRFGKGQTRAGPLTMPLTSIGIWRYR